MTVELEVKGKVLKFEVDTGAAVTVISDATWKSKFPDISQTRSEMLLKTYTGELIPVVSEL